ncbi:MAG: lytic transglycosylase domain-containing protein, partial [Hyphomicrobiaceae bacterium]
MAGGYDDGLPRVLPRQEGPTPFMDTRAGSHISRGIDSLAQGLKQAAAFYDDSVANEQFNEYQRSVTKLMRGDVNKTTAGPDGATATDTGFMGLNGKAAMDARPKIEAELDKLDKEFAARIKSPTALRMFQQAAGKYRLQTTEQISSHTSTQSDVWYKETAAASASLARERIALDPENPIAFQTGAADIINSYVKVAELNGAVKGDQVWNEAFANGKRDALSAQVAAIGVTNPKRAIEILEKNRDIAGTSYDELYNPLRARAAEMTGVSLAARTYDEKTRAANEANSGHIANPAQPIYQQTASAIPGGMSPAGLARLVQIESAENPNAKNPSGKHVGLTQFSEATWKKYGEGDRSDPKQSIIAAQRYAAANAKYLRGFLGRQPTDAELYLAHQQGPGGAQKLLMNPDAPAASLIGTKAVVQNGGKADMTASEFVAMWAHRFNKTTPANAPMSEAPQVTRRPWAQRGMARMAAPGDSAAPAQAD